MKRVPAVFLDRDGTIIEDTGFVRDPEDVSLLPNAVAALKLMREKGYLLYVISNQSGVSRGIISDAQFMAVHERCCKQLQAAGVEIVEFLYCFHHPDDRCRCRKPAAGLIPKQFGELTLAWDKSFTVGDKISDVDLAGSIGATGYLVLTGKGTETLRDLGAAAKSVRSFRDLLAVAEELPTLPV